MRKIVAATFVSLDGVMQAPGGPEEDPSGGFKLGGWTVPYWDDATGAVMDETFSKPFALLLGRKTYDIFAGYWPHYTDGPAEPIAKAFNKVTKYVASRSTHKFDWNNSQWLGEDTVASLKKIKAGDGPDLLIQGSGDLIQTLLKHGLIDEFTVMTFPLLLGPGKRLFGKGAMPAAFKLVKSQTSSTGVIIAKFERAGEVKTGSFA
jgi:dihydrofolate reductase